MKNQLLSLFAVLVLSLFCACEGPQGEPGPAGPQGNPGPAGSGGQSGNPAQGWTYKEGFVKGTAAGVRKDGTPFSYDFNFEGNSSRYSTVTYPYYFHTGVYIERLYAGESLGNGVANISFDVPSLNDLSNPINLTINIDIIKDLGNNKFHSLDLLAQAPISTLSNLSYDTNTGILTGNFSMNFPANSTQGPVTVSNGSFSVRITNFAWRKAAD